MEGWDRLAQGERMSRGDVTEEAELVLLGEEGTSEDRSEGTQASAGSDMVGGVPGKGGTEAGKQRV